eukprot:7533485-Alexandrium_andersonii.AAC.1
MPALMKPSPPAPGKAGADVPGMLPKALDAPALAPLDGAAVASIAAAASRSPPAAPPPGEPTTSGELRVLYMFAGAHRKADI